MAAFDDSADPVLGAACNRLAASVERLPEGMMVDPVSELREDDLGVILRHLYATRREASGTAASAAPAPVARASVPVTARN